MIHNASYLSLRSLVDYRKTKSLEGSHGITPSMIKYIVSMDRKGRIPRSSIPHKTAELMSKLGIIEEFYLLAYSGTPAKDHFEGNGFAVKKLDIRPDVNGEGEGVNTYNLTRKGNEIANVIDTCAKLRDAKELGDLSHLLHGLDPHNLTRVASEGR